MISNEARIPAWAYPALWTLVGLAFAGQHYLTSAKVGAPVAWATAITGALADWYLFGLLAWPAARLARRFNLAGPQWRLRLVLHVLASAVFSLAWILLRSALAHLIVPLRGVEKPFGDVLRYVLVATFFFNILVYWVVVTGTHALAYQRHLRDRERRLLELESRLQSARLHALRMQLNPHFLFNALNAVAALMEEDVREAQRTLTRVSDLLRMALRRAGTSLIPLWQELELVEAYLDVARVRYGAGLEVAVDIDPGTVDIPVPSFLLQPLVENALKHGLAPGAPDQRIRVAARRDGDILDLQVEDNGKGLEGTLTETGSFLAVNPSVDGLGIGLTNTRQRLATLYGNRFALRLRDAPGGGCLVHIRLPIG